MEFWPNVFIVDLMGVSVHFEIIFLSPKYLIVNRAAGKYFTLILWPGVSAIMVGNESGSF